MTQISIACYAPIEGKDEGLKAMINEHYLALREQQLITD